MGENISRVTYSCYSSVNERGDIYSVVKRSYLMLGRQLAINIYLPEQCVGSQMILI